MSSSPLPPPGQLPISASSSPGQPTDVTLWHKVVSASVGTIVTNFLTTPLDVVKTRMQATATRNMAPGTVSFTPTAATCLYYPICKQADATFLRTACVHLTKPTFAGVEGGAAPGAIATAMHMGRTEGVRRLWSGLAPSLVMAVPATTMYFAAYDELKHGMERRWGGTPAEPWLPLWAGVLGRTLTATIVSPLELVRTKTMHRGGSSRAVVRDLWHDVRAGQSVASLWRGWAPTLWRDVPFSGIYWLGYERLKAAFTAYAHRHHLLAHTGPAAPMGMGHPPHHPHTHTAGSTALSFRDTFLVSFASGTVSGGVAATLTTPLDVVKTRRQVQLPHEAAMSIASSRVTAAAVRGGGDAAAAAVLTPAPASVCRDAVPPIPVKTFDLLAFIAREEGVRGLFAGLGARVAKVAPACAIMISSYELGKMVFARQRAHPQLGP